VDTTSPKNGASDNVDANELMPLAEN